MALQWADDFSRYGTGVGSTAFMLDGLPYANIGTGGSSGRVTASPDPNDTGTAFQVGFDGGTWQRDFRIALPTVVTGTIGVGFRAWLESLPGTDNQRCAIVGVQNVSGDYFVYARIEQNGSVTIQGSVATVITQLADSVNPIIRPGTFNHYELVHNHATGAGSFYLNGIERLTYTGVDTTDNVALVNLTNRTGSNPNLDVWFKDLIIWDSTGTQNNTVMGTVIVRRLQPDSDDTLGGWSPSTGSTGFNLLAKDTPDDSTFLSADDTPPSPMIFNVDNLPPDITSVRALLPVVRMRKIDGGDANVQNALSPDGTNWDSGADRPITSAFSYYFDVSELDPATGFAWNPIAVDDVLLRIDRTV